MRGSTSSDCNIWYFSAVLDLAACFLDSEHFSGSRCQNYQWMNMLWRFSNTPGLGPTPTPTPMPSPSAQPQNPSHAPSIQLTSTHGALFREPRVR